MLSEEQLEIISEAITPLFQYLEKEVITDIARRIAKTLTYSRTAELQAMSMAKLGYSPARIRKEAMKILNADPEYRKVVAKNTLEYKREVRKIISDITKEAYKANDDIVANAGNMAWVNDLSVWKSVGKELKDNSFLQQLVDSFAAQTAGELKNITQTTGFKVMSGYEGIENAYRRELDKAVIKICSGTFSQDKVVRDAVHDLAQSGLRSVDFASGYSMQLDTASRLAIRTGCHQLAGKVQDKNIEQTGENLVYVSKHWGARNKGVGHANHEQWQGRVYFIKEGKDYSEEAKRIGQDYITDLWRATGYSADGTHESDPTGLYGYNCRHNHYAWFEGASSFPKNHYEKEPAPVTINGKTYDYYAMTQKMRSMERNIRALKREKEALNTLGIETKEISARIKGKTAEYKDFCNVCGVPASTSRLRYECGTSDLKRTKAWKSFDNVVKASKDGIINVEKTSLFADPNSITQEALKNGGVNRNYYDNEGKQIKQISNHNHGNATRHPFGKNGEHAHDYVWEKGKLVGRPVRELSESERKENRDIL
nr:MAG TPA: minor capsid protein [Caudoviricetes sp.]